MSDDGVMPGSAARALVGRPSTGRPPVSGGQADADRVKALRQVLTATGAGIYLATHVAGPLPAETLAAVHESDELELRIGRVGPDRAEDLEQREWEARAAVAAAIRAPFEQVMLAHGAAEAIRGIALESLTSRVTEKRPGSRRVGADG